MWRLGKNRIIMLNKFVFDVFFVFDIIRGWRVEIVKLYDFLI